MLDGGKSFNEKQNICMVLKFLPIDYLLITRKITRKITNYKKNYKEK